MVGKIRKLTFLLLIFYRLLILINKHEIDGDDTRCEYAYC